MKKLLILIITIFSFNVFAINLLDANKKVVKYENVVKNTQAGVITYGALWCPHCLDDFKVLDKFSKLKPTVDIIVIFTDRKMQGNGYNRFDSVLQFIKEKGYNFKVYYDYNDEFLVQKNVKGVPIQSIINEGRLKKPYESALKLEDLQYIFRKF